MLIPELSSHPLTVLARHEGGFGEVLIVESDDGERAAVKAWRRDLGADWTALADEATKLVNLPQHPNVISIVAFVWHDGLGPPVCSGRPMIVLPAAVGSLRALLAAGPLSPEQAAGIASQIASGLAHLHSHGVLHLDLKPENVLLAEGDRWEIADFGLSIFMPKPQAAGSQPEYVTSGLRGTVPYMSPEHFVSQRLTPKTDVFSLGVILFELLTGRHPLRLDGRATIQDIARQIIGERPSFTDRERARISDRWRGLCLACLEKNPANRPDATEIARSSSDGSVFVPRAQSALAVEVNRAGTLLELGRREEAEQLIAKCLDENPSFLPAVISASEIAYAKGDARGAAELAERALAVGQWTDGGSRDVTRLFVNLANYYLAIDSEQAMRYARRAVGIDPDDWQALSNLAIACRNLAAKAASDAQKRELLDEGIRAVRQALAKAPTDVLSLTTYGHLLVDADDQRALREYRERTRWPDSVFTPRGGDPNVGFVLIRVDIALGEFENAEKMLAPMRKHAQFQQLVQSAERELFIRKQRPRAETAVTTNEDFDGFVVWSVKGSNPTLFVVALRNSSVAGQSIAKQSDPIPEGQARAMLKKIGLPPAEISQAMLNARRHPV